MSVDSQSGATDLNSSYNRGMIEGEEGRPVYAVMVCGYDRGRGRKAGLCGHGVTIRRRKCRADTFK